MPATIELVPGTDAFTMLQLIEKAAAHWGLALDEKASRARSKPIKEYVLTETRLAALHENGIRRQDRPDCRNEVFTLVDEFRSDDSLPDRSANYWNFERRDDGSGFDLRVSISVGFRISQRERGIIFTPLAHGSFLSARHQPSVFEMFKTLVEGDGEAPPVARELAASDGQIIVSWTDLGLGGIRRLRDLFVEFTASKVVLDVAQKMHVFEPDPFVYPRQPGDEIFIPETAQPKILRAWDEQLDQLRANLRGA